MAIAPYNSFADTGGGRGGNGAEQKQAALSGLRALLAEKFPKAPSHGAERRVIPIPMPLVEGSTPVELSQGVVTELTGSLATGGLFLEALLRSTYARRGMMALVDARGSFDPGSLWGGEGSVSDPRAERLERLLWVACETAGSAIKAADLLLRDGNLSTIVLDLQMAPLAELRRIPANTWYRFQRIVEPTGLLFVVLTPLPMVSSAAERWELQGEWNLSAMCEVRAELPIPVQRARGLGGRQPAPDWGTEGERQIA